MSIQAIFDEAAISSLKSVNNLIESCDAFEANQMRCYALRHLFNLSKPLSEMGDEEIDKVESDLIEIFHFKGWV